MNFEKPMSNDKIKIPTSMPTRERVQREFETSEQKFTEEDFKALQKGFDRMINLSPPELKQYTKELIVLGGDVNLDLAKICMNELEKTGNLPPSERSDFEKKMKEKMN